MKSKPISFLWTLYTSLPLALREKISFVYHNRRYPGRLFNTGKLSNAAIYFNACKLLRPGTFLSRRVHGARRVEASAPVRLDRTTGFVTIPPDVIPGIKETVDYSRGLFEQLESTMLKERHYKKAFLQGRSLSELEPDLESSPLISLATHPALVEPIAEYLGMLPVLREIDLAYSPNKVYVRGKSQNFHMDQEDYRAVKVFLYISDITEQSGPLCAIPAKASREVYDALLAQGVIQRRNHKLDDEVIYRHVSPERVCVLTGESGTVSMVDTSSCWHYGSRPGNQPRRVVFFGYVTPFSTKLPWRWRGSDALKFSRAAGPRASRLERLVLGAA